MGVFATRSPHRPNFLGLSLCRLDEVDLDTPAVQVSGVDLLDGTPILDLRPFHPENDVPVGAVLQGWLERANAKRLDVSWADGALENLRVLLPRSLELGFPVYQPHEAVALVEQLVTLDPRPAHLRGGDGSWYMRILSFDVVATVTDGKARITEVRA